MLTQLHCRPTDSDTDFGLILEMLVVACFTVPSCLGSSDSLLTIETSESTKYCLSEATLFISEPLSWVAVFLYSDNADRFSRKLKFAFNFEFTCITDGGPMSAQKRASCCVKGKTFLLYVSKASIAACSYCGGTRRYAFWSNPPLTTSHGMYVFPSDNVIVLDHSRMVRSIVVPSS